MSHSIPFNKTKIIRFITFVLCFNLCHCFLGPKLQIKKALYTKDCLKLSQHFIYDLSKAEVEKSIKLCLRKKEYQKALALLSHLETNSNFERKINIWKQKADIYQNHLFLYSEAILELKKILKHQAMNSMTLQNLLQAQIKKELVKEALKTAEILLNIQDLKNQKKLEIQFIKARLLTLKKDRKKALDLFEKIKKENPKFFNKMQGAFYIALLLEEEERFEEAIKELKSVDWPFSEGKNRHWQYRQKNAAFSR